MSELKSIYAYTQTEGYAYYPGYVNYSQHDNGVMILTVRGTNQEQGQEIELPLSRFWDMVAAVGSFHLPADVEFVPSIFVDELSRKVAELESALAAEQEARKSAEQQLEAHKDMLRQEMRETNRAHSRAEAAEAIIKASREQEPIYEVLNSGVWKEVVNKFDYNVRADKERRIRYAQPPISPDVAELQRQLEEARKVPEGWKLVPMVATRTMQEAAAKLQSDRYPEPPCFGEFYSAMLSASPTTDQPNE